MPDLRMEKIKKRNTVGGRKSSKISKFLILNFYKVKIKEKDLNFPNDLTLNWMKIR